MRVDGKEDVGGDLSYESFKDEHEMELISMLIQCFLNLISDNRFFLEAVT